MKLLIAFSCLLLIAVAQRSRFENIDVDKVLLNTRLVENYYKCMTGKKACPPEANEFKKLLPDLLEKGCESCTPKEKEDVSKVLRYMAKQKPDWWKEVLEIYDPEGVYQAKHKARLDEILST